MADDFKHRILLVDDEESILKSLTRLLRAFNRDIDTRTATTGVEALEILSREKISLIISDQRMPGMNGTDLLRKSRDIAPNTIRILLTGYADIEATIEAINSGAIKYYITKPWDEELLISRINESLDLYRTKSENIRLTRLIVEKNKNLKDLNHSLQDRVNRQTEHIRLQRDQINKSFMETIKALSTIVDLRFKSTGDHLRRVAYLVRRLITPEEIGAEEYQDILIAAFLHDIGKISLPDNIAAKMYDMYSATEREHLQQHPVLGQSFVSAISGFDEIGLIIRHHHESYDGGGYPDGLAGDDIPYGARLIRAANDFDHAAYSGTYPKLKQINDATAMLLQQSDLKYDPAVVKKFIEFDIAKAYFSHENNEADITIIPPNDLVQGMVIAEDTYTKSGLFVVPKGARLSHGMIKRIRKLNDYDSIPGGTKVFKDPEKSKELEHEIFCAVG